VIRIVVTGSECTGKSTLAEGLADHYQAALVPEFVRRFVEGKGSAPVYSDVEEIARGQLAFEGEVAEAAGKLIILDTDLLSTWVYSRHYYGRCPVWISAEVDAHPADLYLLAAIDVPWVADGVQRDRGHMRSEMQALFRAELSSRGFDFVEVEGPVEERLVAAVEAVDGLLSSISA